MRSPTGSALLAALLLPAWPARAGNAGPEAEPPGSMSWKGWQRDLALRLVLDRREAYVGEQVTATLELVSPVEVVDWDDLRPPSLEGFWSEALPVPRESRIRVEGGAPVRVRAIQRLALFSRRAGELRVGPAELAVRVRIAGGGRYGFPEVRAARRASRAATLSVKPLPEGAPPGFSPGDVGAWTLAIEVPSGPQPAGRPFPIRLVARGTGNLRALSLPSLPAAPGLRLFAPATSDEPSVEGGRFGGTRTVEVLVALEREGVDVSLPGLTWSTFDPAAGRYRTAQIPGPRLVAGPVPPPAPAPSGPEAMADELRPLRAEGEPGPRRPPAWRTGGFAAGVAAPPLLFLALAAGLALRRARERTAGARRRRRAGAVALRRLARAGRRPSDDPAQAAEVARALEGYAADRLGEPVSGLTRVALAGRLGGGPAAALVRRLLEACDAGRFGGSGAAEDLVARAEEALLLLEETGRREGGAG